MVLATVDADGQLSQRAVLLKYYDDSGLVFFTNYDSRKAREMAINPRVSLHFLWLELERQIRINGIASRISVAESARYFMSRPKDSQVAAWVSSQSHPLSSRRMLLQKFQEMKRKIGEGKVPLPSFWGGYRVAAGGGRVLAGPEEPAARPLPLHPQRRRRRLEDRTPGPVTCPVSPHPLITASGCRRVTISTRSSWLAITTSISL